MKKSTVIIILIVYLASIVVVGFFGMRVKVYDKVKYIQSIEVTAQAENEKMYSFESEGLNPVTSNHKYKLNIYFTKYHLVDADGKSYLPIILMPQVTYDSGDMAGETEKIKYSINNSLYEERGLVSLSQRGELYCYSKGMSFTVMISPESLGLIGASAEISVFVF